MKLTTIAILLLSVILSHAGFAGGYPAWFTLEDLTGGSANLDPNQSGWEPPAGTTFQIRYGRGTSSDDFARLADNAGCSKGKGEIVAIVRNKRAKLFASLVTAVLGKDGSGSGGQCKCFTGNGWPMEVGPGATLPRDVHYFQCAVEFK